MPRPINYNRESAPPTKKGARAPSTNKHDELYTTILEHIGTPDDLVTIDIRDLWDENHYRANIYRDRRGQKVMSDSYFIYTVPDGVVASPPMIRKYYDDILSKMSSDKGN